MAFCCSNSKVPSPIHGLWAFLGFAGILASAAAYTQAEKISQFLSKDSSSRAGRSRLVFPENRPLPKDFATVPNQSLVVWYAFALPLHQQKFAQQLEGGAEPMPQSDCCRHALLCEADPGDQYQIQHCKPVAASINQWLLAWIVKCYLLLRRCLQESVCNAKAVSQAKLQKQIAIGPFSFVTGFAAVAKIS